MSRQDVSQNAGAAQDEFRKAMKEEMMFRNAGGELIQRIAATHRQCETDLRKVLIQMKMKIIADIIDINTNCRKQEDRVCIDIDIARVATAVLTEHEHNGGSPRHSEPPVAAVNTPLTWDVAVNSWGGAMSATPNLGRSASADSNRVRASTALQLQDMIFRMPTIDSLDDIALLAKDSTAAASARRGSISSMSTATLHPGIRESVQLGSGDEDSFMSGDGKANSKKPLGTAVKCLYMSPESDTIRNAIKKSIREQLAKCSVVGASSNAVATTPVLQAMCGYACARCENGDAEAIEAYAEGALGDQVRIMRSLVNVFLSIHQSSDSGNLFARSSEEKTAAADESLLGAGKDDDNSESLMLTCGQVEKFLKHAVDFGDMMGLQVRFAISFVIIWRV